MHDFDDQRNGLEERYEDQQGFHPYQSMNSTHGPSDNEQYRDNFNQEYHRQNDFTDEFNQLSNEEDLHNIRTSRPVSQVHHGTTNQRRHSRAEINSREARTFEKVAPTEESIRENRDSVVMCRYNPTHILDKVDLDSHEEICDDRRRLKQFGC